MMSFLKSIFVTRIDKTIAPMTAEPFEPRERPAGAQVHHQSRDAVKVSVPGYRRNIVLWMMGAIGFVWFIAIPTIIWLPVERWQGGYGQQYAERSWFWTIVLALGLLWFCIWVFKFLKPRVVISAQSDRIRVAAGNSEGTLFDTRHYSGMRVGHELKSGKVKDHPGLGLFTGLRVGYGNWGEETRFMFQKHRGKEYLLWINQMLEPVVVGGEVHESEVGEREQAF